MPTKKQVSHIKLTSHPGQTKPVPIQWGAPTAAERGPVVGTLSDPQKRNVIGTHSGSYAVYRALAVAAKALDPEHKPDFTDTSPWHPIGPHPQWSEQDRIVSIDPIWRHRARIVLGLLRPGIRHPPEHRDHESTSSDARDQRGDGGREARGRRHDFERRGQLRGHQSRHRALLVPPRSREALRHGGRRAPPDSLRANGRYVPGVRHARRPRGLSAADWRGDRLHLWRGREALGRNESG